MNQWFNGKGFVNGKIHDLSSLEKAELDKLFRLLYGGGEINHDLIAENKAVGVTSDDHNLPCE